MQTKHVFLTFAVVALLTVALTEGRRGEGRRRGNRHRPDRKKDCQMTCFARCLDGTTKDVEDFCNLTVSETTLIIKAYG